MSRTLPIALIITTAASAATDGRQFIVIAVGAAGVPAELIALAVP